MHAEVLPCKVYGEPQRGREASSVSRGHFPRSLLSSGWGRGGGGGWGGGAPAPLPVTTTRGHQGRRIPSVLGVVEKTFPFFS